jgi:hypothetical protein
MHRISMKVFNCLILLLYLQCNILRAQNLTQTIRGTVVEKTTGNPIPGANIVIANSDPLIGTSTDENGKFRLEKVNIGRLELKISFIGYADVVLSDLNLSTSKELVLTVEMEEGVESVKEVVVIASQEKTMPLNKMASISARAFTVEETERYAGARDDVGRMASNFAGVVGNNDARNDIVIRGNTPSGLLWRLDGIDIPNPNHFAAFGTTGGPISMLKNSMLSNSDFLTSAFPAEYGNAIAGVFDLRMRNGNNEHHEYMAQFGFNGLELGAEGPISKKNESSYVIDYSYSSLDLFNNLNIQFGTGSAIPKYQDMSFKVNLPKTKLGHLTLFGLGGISNIALLDSKRDSTKVDFYGSEGWDITNYSTTGVIGASDYFNINSTTNAKITLAATYHDFRVEKDSVVPPPSLEKVPYERSDFTEEDYIASFVVNKKLSAHHDFKIGATLTLPSYDLYDSLYDGSTNKFKHVVQHKGMTCLFQPYIQWQYKILDNLILNPGIHYQYLFYNKSGSLEPRIGLKWYFASSQSISLGFGMHSQMVPINVFYTQVQLPDGTYQKTNDQLGFLHSYHYVIGYDWNISKFMRFKTEAYYQKITHAPVGINSSSDFSVLNLGANFELWSPDTLIGSGTGENYGLEFTLEHFIHKGMYFLFTSSLYDSKYKGSDNVQRNTVFNGNYALNLLAGKEFIFKMKEGKRRQKSILFNLKTTYAGGQRYTPIDLEKSNANRTKTYESNSAFSEQFPPYSRTDLKISFKMNGKKTTVEWALDITNIFNQKNVYTQYFNYYKNPQIYYTYQLGRIIMLQYKITF